MRRATRKASERGFTLIEALVAGALFTVSALGLLTLFYTSAFGSSMAAKMTDATAAAGSKLDELLEANAGSIVAGSETVTFDDTDFTLSWTVTPADVSVDRVGDDFVFVEVEASWVEAPGSTSMQLERTRSISVVGGKPL